MFNKLYVVLCILVAVVYVASNNLINNIDHNNYVTNVGDGAEIPCNTDVECGHVPNTVCRYKNCGLRYFGCGSNTGCQATYDCYGQRICKCAFNYLTPPGDRSKCVPVDCIDHLNCTQRDQLSMCDFSIKKCVCDDFYNMPNRTEGGRCMGYDYKSCKGNGDCKGANMVCDGLYCRCAADYHLNTTSGACVNYACDTTTRGCWHQWDKYRTCSNGHCVCGNGTKLDGNVCSGALGVPVVSPYVMLIFTMFVFMKNY